MPNKTVVLRLTDPQYEAVLCALEAVATDCVLPQDLKVAGP